MAVDWTGKLDPADHQPYVANFIGGRKPVLDELAGEKIAIFDITLDAAAIEAGLIVDDTLEYEAVPINGGTAIRLWLMVDEAKRDDPRFTRGMKLNVIVTIETDSVPARTIQRTWRVNVVQL